jgi:DNA-binding transcriptional ArsR family regulator
MPPSDSHVDAVEKGRQPTRRAKTNKIREYILNHVADHASDITAITAAEFGISRQAMSRHLKPLIDDGLLTATGDRNKRIYKLKPLRERKTVFACTPTLAEHDVWDTEISPFLQEFPKNVFDIWQFCFTEMINNAIDHSGGSEIQVHLTITAVDTEIIVRDNGIGIFRKIQSALNLTDQRTAILELAKGKLTTDPDKHTGQGIFFTSRLLDSFMIVSGEFFFCHEDKFDKDWMLEKGQPTDGTSIFMKLNNQSSRLDEDVFKKFSSTDGISFSKTVVPVTLARYGNEKLVSRSQAKQLLARVDQFETVMLDFAGVEGIGQAFADEIFRVFVRSHPKTKIVPVHMNDSVANSARAAEAG